MKLEELVKQLKSPCKLLGFRNGELIIRGVGVTVALSLPAINKYTWHELDALLSGKRELRIMQHLSRIVGYFSLMHNWNRSKLTELADRHAGKYGVANYEPGQNATCTDGACKL
jgi:glutaredoxin 2